LDSGEEDKDKYPMAFNKGGKAIIAGGGIDNNENSV
jgi:hypothetical protein